MLEKKNQTVKKDPFSFGPLNNHEKSNGQDLNHRNNSKQQVIPREVIGENIHNYIVGESFFYILCVLKFYGLFPASIRNKGRYYGRPSSLIIGWSAWSIIPVLLCLAIYTLNRGFGIPWPVKIFSSLKNSIFVIPPDTDTNSDTTTRVPPFFVWVTMLLQVLIPNTSVMSGLLGLVNVSSFRKFLNGWVTFLMEMDQTFGSVHHVNFNDVRRHKNQLLIYFLLTCLVFTTTMLLFLVATNLLEVDQENNQNNVFSIVFIVVWFQALLGIRMLCNIRDFLSFFVLITAYRELRHAIQAQYDCLQEKISHTHVHSWLELVVSIRDQKTLLEKHIGPQNLWMLVETFILLVLVLTASFVAVMKEIREFYSEVVTFVGFSFLTILLLYCKALKAEAISEEEDLLAESVVEMTASDDCETRLKMKSLCDLMFHDPVNITFGRVTVLNTRLILSFCTQVAATLVILLQFVKN